jgi:uncharacterized membrane protein
VTRVLDHWVEESEAVADESPVVRSRRYPANLAAEAASLAVFNLAVFLPHLLAARLAALAVACLVPGAMLLGAVRVRLESAYGQLAAVVGMSIGLLMAWGAVGSSVLPALGLSRPVERLPSLLAVDALVLVLSPFVPRESSPLLDLVGSFSRRWYWAALAVAGGPVIAIAGVERLNNGRGSALVQVSIGLAVLMLIFGLVAAWRGNHPAAQASLLAASATLLYLYSFRGTHLFGFDIQQEYQRFQSTFDVARWSPPSNGDPYAAMLSITALPSVLAKLTSISGLYLFKGFYPLLLAAVPGLVYEMAARWVPARSAYLGTAYLVALPDFSGQLTALARQEVGFFYFMLLLAVVFDRSVPGSRRSALAVSVLGLLVVSHYSTSYVAVTLMAATWLAYALLRIFRRVRRRPVHGSRPAIGLPLVLAGIAMIVVWDVAITSSSGNVTSFASSVADEGLQILPNSQGGSLITRYLNGNVAGSISPAKYYAEAQAASRATQPWLHPFPVSVTSSYPALPAPPVKSRPPVVDGVDQVTSSAATVVDEFFLLITLVGVAIALARIKRRGVAHLRHRPSLPSEAAILSLAFVAFLIVVRFSGTVVGSYNSDRAQIQGAMVLAASFGLTCEWLISRARRIAVTALVVGLGLVLLDGLGEQTTLGGGNAILLTNSGTAYDYFYITSGEATAAQWLVDEAGRNPLIYTDSYGYLRIWNATAYAARPQTWLTPATVDRGAWVYAQAYEVNDGRAYGSINGSSTVYGFPASFLSANYDTVYSDPTARVYH